MRQSRTLLVALVLAGDMIGIAKFAESAAAEETIKPGEIITADNAARVKDLLAPGTYWKVLHGMQLKIAPTERIDWPQPYQEATEKYSSQVSLSADH
jgi:hypothetical protein